MQDHIETLCQFRQAIYQSFRYRRDSLLDLLDAYSSNEGAHTPVELSLNPLFRRQYSALYKAMAQAYTGSDYPVCSLEAYEQGAAVLDTIPARPQQSYQVFGIDETPNERLYARCLSDRQTIHRSTPVSAQRPVSEGHNYSVLAALPAEEAKSWSRWAVPISVERVSSMSNAIEVAHNQIAQLLSYRQGAEVAALKILVVDSRYSTREFLYGLRDHEEVLAVTRVRSNRKFYSQPEPGSSKTRPRWYGQEFQLNEPATWPPANQTDRVTLPQAHGQITTWQLQRWTNLLMRGTGDYPMHRYPFDLLRVQRLDASGQPQGKALWLLLWGTQRQQLTSAQLQQAYAQRFHLEHFFGFAKSHLLFTASQTCCTDHEITTVRLACLAYVQLWLARHLTDSLPLPWQRYLPQAHAPYQTPRQVQRGFAQVIRQIGSIALPPKTRGISPGRPQGFQLTPRPFRPLVKFHPPRKFCPCQDSQDAA